MDDENELLINKIIKTMRVLNGVKNEISKHNGIYRGPQGYKIHF